MRTSYTHKIAELETEAAALAHELEHAPERLQGQIRARLASAQRSLQWYRTRSRPRPLHETAGHRLEAGA